MLNTHFGPDAAFAADLEAHDREAAKAEEIRALWRLRPEQRVAKMRRGELSFNQLIAWTRARPHEVPKIGGLGGVDKLGADHDTIGDAGEFEWIVYMTVEWIEANDREKLAPVYCRNCERHYSGDGCRCGDSIVGAALADEAGR